LFAKRKAGALSSELINQVSAQSKRPCYKKITGNPDLI